MSTGTAVLSTSTTQLEPITVFTGVFLYALVMAGQLITAIYSLVKKIDKPVSPQSFFSYTVIGFCILRIAHVSIVNDGSAAAFFVNRFAFLLFLTALSITLYTWMAALGIVLAVDQGLAQGVRAILNTLQYAFIIGNAVFYIMQIITIAVYYSATSKETKGNPWYDASILIIACVVFLMGVLFVYQSFRLYNESTRCSPGVQDVLFKAAVCSIIVAVFFALRVCFLLYRPISGKFLDYDGFFWGCYYLPELVPLFLSLIVHSFRITGTKLSFGYGERPNKPRKSGISREDAEAAGWTPRNTKGSKKSTDGNSSGGDSGAGGGGAGSGANSSGPRGVSGGSGVRGDPGFSIPVEGDENDGLPEVSETRGSTGSTPLIGDR